MLALESRFIFSEAIWKWLARIRTLFRARFHIIGIIGYNVLCFSNEPMIWMAGKICLTAENGESAEFESEKTSASSAPCAVNF